MPRKFAAFGLALGLALLSLFALNGGTAAQNGPQTGSSQHRTTFDGQVLVELFTSQGCSS